MHKRNLLLVFIWITMFLMSSCGDGSNDGKSETMKTTEMNTEITSEVIEEIGESEELDTNDTERDESVQKDETNMEQEYNSESENIADINSEKETDEIITDTYSDIQPEESWVAELSVAKTTTQIVIVSCTGVDATVSMHSKNENGVWIELFSTAGKIGRNGIGKEKEGDKKTLIGIYNFNKAFGVKQNPGISCMSYLQLDESYYWVDDVNSKYYNQCVSINEVEMDWQSSEHLYKVVPQYNYVLSINYNEECVQGKGSAIFLHCTSKSFGTTAGCIAIPEEYMIKVMKNLRSDCVIVIDSADNIKKY